MVQDDTLNDVKVVFWNQHADLSVQINDVLYLEDIVPNIYRNNFEIKFNHFSKLTKKTNLVAKSHASQVTSQKPIQPKLKQYQHYSQPLSSLRNL